MPLCSNVWCLKEGELAEIDGKKLCRICAINSKSNKIIKNLFKKEEIKKEVIAKCSECLNSVYNTDPPRKFHKNFGFEYFFNSNEVEEIVLCKSCYQKKSTIQKIRNRTLFLCAITLLILWLYLFSWKKINKLWNEHPVKLTLFVTTIIFTFLIFSSFESILSIPTKIKKRIEKTWKYIKHSFIKKEKLLFQSQEDKNLSWYVEAYVDKKLGFCSMCQGGEILDKDKTKQKLFLTLKREEIKWGNKILKESTTNNFCLNCSKKKIEELRINPSLKNPEKLKSINSWFFN